MAELCRAAQVAFRSTSLLRTATPRWSSFPLSNLPTPSTTKIRQICTTPILRSAGEAYAPTPNWYNKLDRETPPKSAEEVEIKKPVMDVYEDPYLGDFSVAFDSGELRNKPIEDRPAPARPTLRLVPRTGRTIHVGRNVDVARSFKLLAIQVAQNKLRQDFQLQRFHERPGLKQKRLKSERWQRRFKKGFKACVSRVKELTNQGW